MELSFGFLKEAAGFPISNPPIDYEARHDFRQGFFDWTGEYLIDLRCGYHDRDYRWNPGRPGPAVFQLAFKPDRAGIH